MAKSDQINIRIALEGGPEIVKTLNDLGIDGEKVLKNLQKVGNLKADGTLQALRKVQAQFTELGKQIDGVAKKFTSIGKSFSTRLTLPIVGAGVGILKQASDFEAATNDLAVNARLVGAEFDAASKKAQALGQASVFSSTEAAKGMTELAKVGLDFGQIMGGAADAMVNLAAANNAGLEASAGVVGDILNQFRLNAAQLPGLVDQITGATIESKLSFDDYAQAIGQAGGAAGALGVKFDQFNAVLAATASSFSSGSDAGTSFKTFLTRLVPQSDEAAAVFKELNLRFFDAQGNMRSMAEIAQELQDKLGGLSQQDLNTKLKTVFGVDAIRTAIALMRQGGKGITDIMAKLKATDSAEIARVRVKGLRGELDQFNSAIENLSIAIGKSGLLGYMTQIVQKGTDWAQTLANLDSKTLSLGTKVGALVAAIGPLLIGLGAIGRGVGFVVRGFADLIGAGILLRNAFLWITPWGRALLIAAGAVETLRTALNLVKNRQYDAATAAKAHKDAIDQLKTAQEAAKNGVPGAEAALKRLAQAHIDTAKATLADANAALEQKRLTLEALQEQVNSGPFAEYEKKFGTDLPAALQEVTEAQIRVARSTRELNELQAAAAGKPFGNVIDLRDNSDKATQSVGTLVQKVDDLNRKITVTSFGGDSGGPVKKVYDLVNGVAKAVDQSKTAVDGLEKSVDQSGAAVDGATGKITGSLESIPPAAQQAAGAVQQAFAGLDGGTAATVAAAILAPFEGLGGQIAAILDAAHGMTTSGFGTLRTEIASLATSIRAQIAQILTALRQAIDTARAMRAAANSDSLGSNNQPGLAGGGHLSSGPGTSTSDSILARLSVGEFVARAKAVNYYGPGLFHMLNQMKISREALFSALSGLRGYNFGGIVEGLRGSLDIAIPRLAGGGMIEKLALAPAAGGTQWPAGTTNVNLNIGGRDFALVGSMEVAAKLGGEATRQGMNSLGRKPGWYR